MGISLPKHWWLNFTFEKPMTFRLWFLWVSNFYNPTSHSTYFILITTLSNFYKEFRILKNCQLRKNQLKEVVWIWFAGTDFFRLNLKNQVCYFTSVTSASKNSFFHMKDIDFPWIYKSLFKKFKEKYLHSCRFQLQESSSLA